MKVIPVEQSHGVNIQRKVLQDNIEDCDDLGLKSPFIQKRFRSNMLHLSFEPPQQEKRGVSHTSLCSVYHRVAPCTTLRNAKGQRSKLSPFGKHRMPGTCHTQGDINGSRFDPNHPISPPLPPNEYLFKTEWIPNLVKRALLAPVPVSISIVSLCTSIASCVHSLTGKKPPGNQVKYQLE